MDKAVQNALWWTATLFILAVCLATCQPKPAYAIISCATPEEVRIEGVERGWTFVKNLDSFPPNQPKNRNGSIAEPNFVLVELWEKNGKKHNVWYIQHTHRPFRCYYDETPHIQPGTGFEGTDGEIKGDKELSKVPISGGMV